MRTAASFAFVALLLALTAGARAAPRDTVGEVLQFSTPSRNIGCVYAHLDASRSSRRTPSSLRCDIRSGLRPRPARPPGCGLDWGDSLTMNGTGRVHVVCHGDTALGGRNVLGYGRTWRQDGFTCVSRRSGLTCRNRSGHGFFLSRQRSRSF